ncbi:aspartate-alanine antiporter [Pandoraea communis]|uniref:Aspartate:alanine antiporter n=1 Tax=Pandoraea communis TaxID=2508297 RepID=A0A5E4YQE9_9BURK|nr:aspartate-alanine antiporter [Pandoraea communis]MDM8358324.1 aspartate-alanine antiporter [Pandoraea communis]VVE51021.1 aspartate:alanine antiporter [Pandoraea communis]
MQCSVPLFDAVPLITVFVCVVLGQLLGRVRLGPIQLGGVCGALLVALLVGQTGCMVEGSLKDFAFALFIFAMGFSAGPQFVDNLNLRGLRFGVLSIIEVVFVFGIVMIAVKWLGLDSGTAGGLAAGAATESAMVGTAIEALNRLGLAPETFKALQANVVTAYTLTYVFGLITIVLFTNLLAPRLLGIDLKQDSARLAREMEDENGGEAGVPAAPDLVGRSYRVAHPGLSVAALEAALEGSVAVERVRRASASVPVAQSLALEPGDELLLVGRRDVMLEAHALVGPEVAGTGTNEIVLVERDFVMANKEAEGRTVSDLRREAPIDVRHGVFVKSVRRMGMPLPSLGKIALQRGDVVTLQGLQSDVDRAGEVLGKPVPYGNKTSLVFVGLALIVGLCIGHLSVRIGGVPMTLGSGGGALLSGLASGWLLSRRPTWGAFPPAAYELLKDLGLAVFVVCVGLSAGPQAAVLLREHGLALPVVGISVSLIPALVSLWVGHKLLRIDGPILIGAIAGQQASTPAISAVVQTADSALPVVGYTVTYALSNVLLPLMGPAVVFVAHQFSR